jgi:S-layer homology domain
MATGKGSGIINFLKTLLIGGGLGAIGVIALLFFGPPGLRNLFASKPVPAPTAQTPVAPSAPTAPTPAATASAPASPTAPTAIGFDDIQGVFGEKEITQLAQLGVFESASGKFNPQQTITRAEFVRLLVRANNAIWFDQSDKMIRPAAGGTATFPDVPTSHPNFQYIQGVINAGFAVGFDEKAFKPDEPLTREQMVAIKIGVDKGGLEEPILKPDGKRFSDAIDEKALKSNTLASHVPDWTDRAQISKQFVPAFNSQAYLIYGGGSDRWMAEHKDPFQNVNRAFGAVKALRPQAPVTRAEAAAAVALVGNHQTDRFKIVLRNAEDALKIKAGEKPKERNHRSF